MAGLPGTGKTTLARELAKVHRGTILNKDEIRATLFGPDDIEYSTEQDDFCMDVMLQTAGFLLRKKPAPQSLPRRAHIFETLPDRTSSQVCGRR